MNQSLFSTLLSVSREAQMQHTAGAPPLSLFSLAPRLEHHASGELQQAFAMALERVRPGTRISFKRFPARSFKRLNAESAERLFFDLLLGAEHADVLHLHLDWHATLGHYPMHQCLNLWLHVLKTQRFRPVLAFPVEGPLFLDNPLMIRERKAWAFLIEHFNETPHHQLIVHEELDYQAWLSAGLQPQALRMLPRPMAPHATEAPLLQPELWHLLRQRLTQHERQPFVLGYIPSDDDPAANTLILETLKQAPAHMRLLVMGGGEAQNPQYRWETHLLEGIRQQGLQARVIITGPADVSERATYLNSCQAVYLAHHHRMADTQTHLYEALLHAPHVFISKDRPAYQTLQHLYASAFQDATLPVHSLAMAAPAAPDVLLQALKPLALFEKQPGSPLRGTAGPSPDKAASITAFKARTTLLREMELEGITRRYLNCYDELQAQCASI
jgi:hypothetical protein